MSFPHLLCGTLYASQNSYSKRAPSTQYLAFSVPVGYYRPAWITWLLWVLVPMPGRRSRSRTQTLRLRRAIAHAVARPITPAPMTAASTLDVFVICLEMVRYRVYECL